ncbi:MAG: hypothetical protein R3B47_10245 [Bacteroidia bacterium]
MLGVPVAWSIGISSVCTMLVSISTMPAITTVAQRMATGLDSFALYWPFHLCWQGKS